MLYIYNNHGQAIGHMQGDTPVYYTGPLPASFVGDET
jgi:hypothetical protein